MLLPIAIEIALLWIDEFRRNVQHFLFRHAKDVKFFLIRKILIVEVSVRPVHVPVFDDAGFELQEKALILVDRAELLSLHVDERILFLEAIAHCLDDGGFHGADDA